jgi:dihydrodipicolinate synthase/N-acetylneuraminate lyase
MATTDAIRGMLLPMPTVFDGNGEVDEPLMRDMVQFYVSTGVNGLFVCGSYGNGPAMRPDQRKRVAEIVIEEVRQRIPVVIHIGAVEHYTAIDLGVHAREQGADAVGMVGPYYYNDHTENEVLLHYQKVDAAVQLPMLIYNNPAYQGYAIKLPLMQQLCASIPRIFGGKLAMGSIDDARAVIEAIPGFAAFALSSGLMPGMLQGIRGTISPPLTLVPELGVALVRAIDARRDEEATRLQAQVSDVEKVLIRVWKQYGRTPYAEGMRALGFAIKEYPRWPTAPLPEEERAPLLDLLKQARGVAVAGAAAS